MKNFENWLITFAEEKQIDLSEYVEAGEGTLQVGDVLSAMLSAPPTEQALIKMKLVQIDFKNGDVLDYVRHLAKALNQSHKIGMG